MNRLGRVGAGALALALLAVPGVQRAFSSPDVDLTGDWSLAGTNSNGSYSGKAVVSQDGDAYTIRLEFKYANGGKGDARFEGKKQGDKLVGKRIRSTGLLGWLTGSNKKKDDAQYVVSADGLKLSGSYTKKPWLETLSRSAAPSGGKATLTIDADRDGKLTAADRTAAIQGKKALLTLVPGAPASVLAPASVNVAEGKVKVEVAPAGIVKILKGNAEVTELPVGTHELKVQPVKDGAVEIRLLSGGAVVDKASFSVEKEHCYLILFGYMGAEINYLESDLSRVKSNVLPKLQQAGFSVIEDGQSYDQKTIDAKLADPRTVKKVIVDWCVTPEDWNNYFARASIRGYAWSSHGFMEPYPGGPDEDLKKFESRQWSSAAGDPASTGKKHFTREWKAHFEKNAYSKMDFALNHSCCTDGLGSYGDQPWQYCTPATLDRARAVFGTNLPAEHELTYVGHNTLKSFFNFQQGYVGPSYFGMWDVSWSELTKAIKP